MTVVRKAMWCAVTFVAALTVHADPPATEPSLRVEHVTANTGVRAFGDSAFSNFSADALQFVFAAPIDQDLKSQFDDYLKSVRVTQGSQFLDLGWSNLLADNVAKVSFEAHWRGNSVDFVQPDRAELAAALTADLKLDAAISVEQRKADIARKRGELAQLEAAASVLGAMLQAKAPQDQRSLADRLASWQGNAADLKEWIRAKRFRLDALQKQRYELINQRKLATAEDPVAAQLKKIVELRKQQLSTVEQNVKAGSLNESALPEGKLAVAEAELRLAERSTSAVSSATKASLDEIERESTKLSVDMDEMGNRLNDVETRLKPYRLTGATTQSLAKMATLGYAAEDDSKSGDLMAELNQKIVALRVELFRLQIVKIEALNQG